MISSGKIESRTSLSSLCSSIPILRSNVANGRVWWGSWFSSVLVRASIILIDCVSYIAAKFPKTSTSAQSRRYATCASIHKVLIQSIHESPIKYPILPGLGLAAYYLTSRARGKKWQKQSPKTGQGSPKNMGKARNQMAHLRKQRPLQSYFSHKQPLYYRPPSLTRPSFVLDEP